MIRSFPAALSTAAGFLRPWNRPDFRGIRQNGGLIIFMTVSNGSGAARLPSKSPCFAASGPAMLAAICLPSLRQRQIMKFCFICVWKSPSGHGMIERQGRRRKYAIHPGNLQDWPRPVQFAHDGAGTRRRAL